MSVLRSLSIATINSSRNMITKLPKGTIDTHMHVIDHKFPLSKSHGYRPYPATAQQSVDYLCQQFGIDRLCVVQPSIYGTDNSCTLDALQSIGFNKSRGIAVIDPATITTSELQTLHDAGVRGIRINLRTHDARPQPVALKKLLQDHADIIRPFGWSLQFYSRLESLVTLHDFIPTLGVKICLDHFACTEGAKKAGVEDPLQQSGFKELLSLISNPSSNVYVKISGAYRLSDHPSYEDLNQAARLLLSAGPDRCVWATDWPHTPSVQNGINSDTLQPYRSIDLKDWIRISLSWCDGNQELAQKLFVDNSVRLLDF